jgi:protein gp37
MSDWFHAWVPTDFIARVFAVMAATPQHTYQVLTKRATKLRRLAPELPWSDNVWMGVSVENLDVADRASSYGGSRRRCGSCPVSRCWAPWTGWI